MRVRYLPEALAEYEATATWYDEQSPGSGDNFVDAIERAEAVIAATPATSPQWPLARPGIRRYLVPSYLYSIAFRSRHRSVNTRSQLERRAVRASSSAPPRADYREEPLKRLSSLVSWLVKPSIAILVQCGSRCGWTVTTIVAWSPAARKSTSIRLS